MSCERKLMTEQTGDALQHTLGLLDNFRTDPVTGQEDDIGFQDDDYVGLRNGLKEMFTTNLDDTAESQ